MLKKILLLSTALLFTSISYATPKPDPTTYPDVTQIPAPVITLRNMFTSVPVNNDHYGERSDKNVHWSLIDVSDPEFRPLRDGGSAVQFQAFDTNKCWTGGGVTDCSDKTRTVFSIIPTDTGAVLIRHMAVGFCVASFDIRQYQLLDCGRTTQGRTFDLPYLWALLPPSGQSKLLVPPVK
ncbi:hypothetical protein B0186_07705 [Canicola haemoglobinophilus]|uniref:Cytolethal distending toxin protein C n=1 Tax=Canicola haemoglobinophilus TaxID=733 RepID=A0A1V4B089_9PAST|nr:hypothetical protein [Canicola haemoglobinophilus]OOR99494.1 hypothetical protein B0186_07705 [Canicola haemoglobinophilus]STO54828.1 cytolethal distending toxin protein C [Canicola haemoglobinophilus]STO59722.1 cytolethal distending toxin protein C [Canicola haemoglobinophilus]STO69601.1 cytolethal distending toxin protein C [Canicola haemoglobinophilus]